MPPNQDEAVFDIKTHEASLAISATIETPPSSEASFSLASDSDSSSGNSFDPGAIVLFGNIRVPLEQNLRELLLRVTESDHLEQVTQVKLKVIAREVSLQHLSIHTPNLRELTLDGSVVSSLRDLGCRLRCLKVLRVNRCGLTSFDGLFGLETIEELYAGFNLIRDISPCSSLPHIKVLDVKSNKLKEIAAVSFLILCPNLEHLVLEGNENIANVSNYRGSVKKWLPKLVTLDGTDFANVVDEENLLEKQEICEHEETDYSDCMDEMESEDESICLINNNKDQPSSTKTNILPPINTNCKRPNTTHGVFQTATVQISRPATSHSSGSRCEQTTHLPDILGESRKLSPSSLTSGAPICGNIAASLRNRLHRQEAWPEAKKN